MLVINAMLRSVIRGIVCAHSLRKKDGMHDAYTRWGSAYDLSVKLPPPQKNLQPFACYHLNMHLNHMYIIMYMWYVIVLTDTHTFQTFCRSHYYIKTIRIYDVSWNLSLSGTHGLLQYQTTCILTAQIGPNPSVIDVFQEKWTKTCVPIVCG